MDRYMLRRIDALYRRTRRWFHSRKFAEVRTNAMGPASGFDGYVRPFEVGYSRPGGESRLYLASSPEFEMKKLAFGGSGKLFQIARAFRNAEHDPTHRPEFDMLEWYVPDTDYRDAMGQTEDLIRCAVRETWGNSGIVFRGTKVRLDKPFVRIRMRDLFLEATGIDLARVQDRDDFLEAARNLGVTHLRPTASWDTVFFIVFLEKVEDRLRRMEKPVVLLDHPVQVASLAKQSAGSPEFVERFEVYVRGLELCNGYSELTDREGHLRRLELVNSQRRQEGFLDLAFPADFLASLPGAEARFSGVALGMDRLAMIATGSGDIAGVVPFDPFAAG